MIPLPYPIGEWLLLTVRDPRAGARTILDLDLDEGILWQVLVLFTALSTIVIGLPELFQPSGDAAPGFVRHPLLLGALNLGVSAAGVWGIAWTGRMFGGQGRPRDVLALTAWFQVIQFVLVTAVFLVTLILPPLGGLLALAGSLFSLWLLLTFIDEAHGFQNLLLAFLTFAAWIFAFSMFAAILLSLFGLGPQGVPGDV